MSPVFKPVAFAVSTEESPAHMFDKGPVIVTAFGASHNGVHKAFSVVQLQSGVACPI
ncbi:hypothetical protein MYP_3383 [Sporocytophaga myxococcoides]|uniref:Uncharacterized protein n=1 Tax=Sporocytophaga myxococcoides TaxID=153721 RepID=A0A098LI56_9BACT|nr:hypothetical protein MYP_3383 [Sporocytophaga myxococcoides]